MADNEDRAGQRVWLAVPPGTRDALARLPPADLQTLLIDVARARAGQVTPAGVLRRWQQDRFVRPSAADPRRVSAVEARLWQMQPTDGRTDLAACQRQLRAQDFGPGAAAHFRLFALVSSARDSGSCRTEASLITRHLACWLDVLAALIPHREPRVELTVFDHPVLAERLADTIRPGLDSRAAFLIDKPGRTRGRGYYRGFALRITAEQGTVELGDGGLTSWTAQLTQDAKERCLVSCIATERLTALCGDG